MVRQVGRRDNEPEFLTVIQGLMRSRLWKLMLPSVNFGDIQRQVGIQAEHQGIPRTDRGQVFIESRFQFLLGTLDLIL